MKTFLLIVMVAAAGLVVWMIYELATVERRK